MMDKNKKIKFSWLDGRVTYLWPHLPLVIAGGEPLTVVIEQFEAGAPVDYIAQTVSERFQAPLAEVWPYVQRIVETLAGLDNTPVYTRNEEVPGGNQLSMATLNLTRGCNLRCAHCYAAAGQGSVQPTPTGVPLISPNYLREWTCEQIQFTVIALSKLITQPPRLLILSGGEPTLVSDLVRTAVITARENDLTPRLNTNGVGITENMARFLAANQVLVQISIDGLDASTHNLIRGQGNSFEVALRAIKRLVEHGCQVRLSCTTHQENIAQVPSMIMLAQELGCEQFITSNLVLIGRALDGGLKQVPFEEEFAVIYEAVKDDPAKQIMTRSTLLGETIGAMRDGIKFTYCGTGCSTVCIDAGGKIYPCINLLRADYCAGDLAQGDNLEEVWMTSPLLAELRCLNIDTMNRACAQCPFRYFCGGYCRGETLAAGGLLTDPYARCKEWRRGLIKVLDFLSETPDLYSLSDKSTTGGLHRE